MPGNRLEIEDKSRTVHIKDLAEFFTGKFAVTPFISLCFHHCGILLEFAAGNFSHSETDKKRKKGEKKVHSENV